MKRFLLLFALMMPLWSAFQAIPSFAAEKQKLIVGGDHENPPYEFLENGQATGFNVEVMRAVAAAVGAEVEFHLAPWNEVRTALEEGRIDALAGMYYSEERSRLVDFSVPHTMVSAGLFVRDGSEIRSLEDLKGKEIIAQKGDVIDDYLRREDFAARIIEVKDPADELRLLASGKHDCALMPSRIQGEYFIRELGISGIRGMNVDLPQLRYCFAVRKGNAPLRYRLDEGLNLLKLNGSYQDIYDKWFGVYEQGKLWRTVRYFVWALTIIASLLAASSSWSWFLRREVRKRTAELRDREEKLRFTQFAIDNATDQAFWMTDGGRLCYVNDAACRNLGYSRAELLTLSIPDIDPIFQPERFAEHWRDLQQNGNATFETVHRAKDGRIYPVEIRANHVMFDGREYNCAFATDISERKRSEEALRESEEKFRVLAETSPAAIFLYQGDKYVYVSPSAIRLTGYSEREFLEMNFWDFVHKDFREIIRERGLARLRGEPVPSQYEIKIVAKNGEEKWLYISAGRIDYRGGPAGIVSMFDVTDRKRVEEELQQAYDGLEKQVQERTAELRRANALLEEEINTRNRTERVITARLRLLELAATHSLNDLLEATIDEAEALTGSTIGFYHFLESDQKTLSLQSWSTRTKAEFCRAEGSVLHYDLSQAGVWVDCIHERKPVIHNDYASLPHRKGLPPEHVALSRELVLPVFRGDNIVAIIGVGNKPQDYTAEDIEAVSFLADLAWEIVERKQAEEQLRLSQFCLDKAGIGIYQTDGDGTIFMVNEHACNSLGYSKEELCALTVYDIDPDITPEKMLELKGIIEKTGSITHYTTRRRRDGSTFPVEITANNLVFRGKAYGISFVKDITQRQRAEEALRESESRVRRKLESILDPGGDIGELELADIIDAPGIQALMYDLYRHSGFKMSIIDLKGKMLVDVGWQEICLKYHRCHPRTRRGCHESNTVMTEGVPPGEFREYRCKNLMRHLVTPIMVGERHMGNLFMGQFFYENEELDYELFRSRAKEFGFPEAEYLAAMEAVPRHSEEFVNNGKAFFLRFIDMFSRLSYGNIKLARLLAERDRLTEKLREANLVVENSPVVLFRWEGSDEWPVEMVSGNVVQFGYEPEEFLSRAISYASIIHPADLERVTREVHHVRDSGGDLLRLEYRILTKGGDVRWVNEITHLERDAEGGVKTFEGVVIDITERKRAEEKLRENLQLLQAMAKNAPIVLYGINRDGVFTLSEGKGLAGMGLKPGEIVGRSLFDVYRGMPESLKNLRRVLAGEAFVAPLQAGDRIYDAYHEPVFDGNGEYAGTFGVMVDVTEQRRAEELIRESRAKYQAIVDHFEGYIYVCTPDYRVEFLNNKLMERAGYDATGEFCYQMMHNRDSVCPWCVNDRVFAGETIHWEMFSPKENRWFYVVNVPIHRSDGAMSKQSMMLDITDRKLAEEELRKANMVVESSPVVLFRCKAEPGWPVELVSKNVVQFGYRPEEFLSGELNYASIVHPRDLEKLTTETEAYSAAGEEKWFQEYRIVTKDGNYRWIIDETICKRNEEGEISHYEGVIIDVTERKLAEEKLRWQKHFLEELNLTLEDRVREEVAKNREKDFIMIQQNRQAALGEILDHVAHQWKQPLNSISLTTYLLKEGVASTREEVVDISDKILELVDNMAQTINVFRDFYRPDKTKNLFSIEESIDRALSFIRPTMSYEAIDLQVETDRDLKALGYPKEFAQVILNLVGNAREAFKEKKAKDPKVIIKGYSEDGMVVVTVSDNAGGIDEKIMGNIFDLDFTTKEASGGTGVGLYLAKSIIESHMGGRLTVENVAEGAQFSILLETAENGGNA